VRSFDEVIAKMIAKAIQASIQKPTLISGLVSASNSLRRFRHAR
jgi:hypothetical protein